MALISLQPSILADAVTPDSAVSGDIGHVFRGGLELAQQVFIGGNCLPENWQGRQQFVIIETGFGPGLNFLATWAAWKADPQRCQKLHFIAIEAHPFAVADLIQLQQHWPQLQDLAQQLQRQWPCLTPGSHRLLFEGGQLELTLIFDDVESALKNLVASADAIYLNRLAFCQKTDTRPERVFRGLGKLACSGTTLATLNVDESVFDILTRAGFVLRQQTGFGNKKAMLAGEYRVSRHRAIPAVPTHAIVIGAGLAGCQIAERLAIRGCKVTLIESLDAPAKATSGNWAGCFLPAPSSDDNLASRFTRAGFLALQQQLPLLQRHYPDLSWSACGVLQMGKDAASEQIQRQTVAALRHPWHHLQYLDRAQASERCGVNVAAGGWWFPDAGWIRPPTLCQALLVSVAGSVEYHWSSKATSLQQNNSIWYVNDASGHLIAEAPVVVIANAADAVSLLPQMRLPLSRIRGQISYVPQGGLSAFHTVLCRDGYVLPAIDGKHVLGASYDFGEMATDLLESAHQGNMQRLADILPGDVTHVETLSLQGRVGFRCVSTDRMPLVGSLPNLSHHVNAGTDMARVPRSDGLYCLLGLGSRGLVWSGIAAELLANQICGEPWRLERDLAEALDPARFWLRELRRGKAVD